MTDQDILNALPETPAPATQDEIDAKAEAFLSDAILRTRRAYFAANCPRDFQEFDACRPELQANREQINRILSWNPTQDGKGIIASGETCKGKTRAMFALCKRLLCEQGRDVAIWHAKDWFSELEGNLRFGRDEAGDFVKRTAMRPILFIDDYGQEAVATNRQEWAQGWFFKLLDIRIGNRLPLLVTTNLTATQMKEGVGRVTSDPLVRRFVELAEPIKFQ